MHDVDGKSTIVRLPDLEQDSIQDTYTQVTTLQADKYVYLCIKEYFILINNNNSKCRLLWHGVQAEQVATLSGNKVSITSLENECSKNINTLECKGEVKTGSWDPHHPSLVAITTGRHVAQVWDIRSQQTGASFIADGTLLDLDYNPNKPFHIVTSGTGCRLQFWDVRKCTTPIASVGGHKHWTWSAKYNRFHDQLILSSSSDRSVHLWRMSSISSTPSEHTKDTGNENGDGSVEVWEGFDESVYSVAWSACDSWIFTAVAYNGHVTVHEVPSAEKYKILL